MCFKFNKNSIESLFSSLGQVKNAISAKVGGQVVGGWRCKK